MTLREKNPMSGLGGRTGRLGSNLNVRNSWVAKNPASLPSRTGPPTIHPTQAVGRAFDRRAGCTATGGHPCVLSADKFKSYCLSEAPNAEAIRVAAKRLNIPADTIIEVGGELRPEMFA
jgi:hypothetical protein